MSQPEWVVIDPGVVPADARKTEFTCTSCGVDAMLPVVGVPIAQVHDGLVFDPGEHAMPVTIRCPACGRTLETA